MLVYVYSKIPQSPSHKIELPDSPRVLKRRHSLNGFFTWSDGTETPDGDQIFVTDASQLEEKATGPAGNGLISDKRADHPFF